jgi:hypothetical protein
VSPGAEIHRAGDWLLVTKRWQAGDSVGLSYGAVVEPVPATNGEFYIRRGPLFYAVGIPGILGPIKDFPLKGFHDYTVSPVTWGDARYAIPALTGGPLAYPLVPVAGADPRFPWDASPLHLNATIVSLDTMKTETVGLVPMGSGEAVLRRMTFPATP